MKLFPNKIYIFQEHHQQQLPDQSRQLYHQIMVLLFLSFFVHNLDGCIIVCCVSAKYVNGRLDHAGMVIGFTTTCAISACNH